VQRPVYRHQVVCKHRGKSKSGFNIKIQMPHWLVKKMSKDMVDTVSYPVDLWNSISPQRNMLETQCFLLMWEIGVIFLNSGQLIGYQGNFNSFCTNSELSSL
jgi:hypothetical protein